MEAQNISEVMTPTPSLRAPLFARQFQFDILVEYSRKSGRLSSILLLILIFIRRLLAPFNSNH